MTTYSDNADHIRVDEGCLLARYADWHARIKGRPVAAMGAAPQTDEAMLYVADEVLIDADDWELADELKSRYGAEPVPEAPLPAPPAALMREACKPLDGMPQTMRLRFRSPPPVDGAAGLLAQVAQADSARCGTHQQIVTSDMGAAVAAVVAQQALAGRGIGLNLFGQTLAMPLTTATEGPMPGVGSNPFVWNAFAGRTRMVQAWQLVDSIRQVRGNRFTTIAILDNGFWLDGRGVPLVPPGQAASDFGNAFAQVNLQDESRPAGGMNPKGYAWHGNAVASAAAAVLKDGVGAAGSAGNVAMPLFFQTDISVGQILRCVRICAAWGIDVLNMSIGTWETELYFPTGQWNRTFQFAADNGVIMIAAAGNDDLNLPDDRNVRPATRSPGVLTVGALDAADNAAGFSNHGSSVWLWAPGVGVPVAPDGANPTGSQRNGTSFASPIVAGVAAMMRFANDRLSADDVRRILVDTGWQGSGRVSRGLDAYAAVFMAISQTLPDNHERNNTPATAAELMPVGTSGMLGAGSNGFSARSNANDRDYWRFRVERFSTVTLALDWYERLGTLSLSIEADDPETRDAYAMLRSGDSSSGRMVLSGPLPQGAYRVAVSGSAITAYRLLVTRKATPLPADEFERNDSFAQAAGMLFESTRWTLGVRTWAPGTYDATLHQERGVQVVLGGPLVMTMNDDYFRLVVPRSGIGRRPRVSINDSDALLDVTLFDDAQRLIQTWPGVRKMAAFPPENSTCYLKVAAKAPTRYRITTRMSADPKSVPGPLQEELELIPKWWGDPAPFRLDNPVTHYAAQVNVDRGDGQTIVFEQPQAALRLALVDGEGQLLREAEAVDGRLVIDTVGMAPGTYRLRATLEGAAKQGPVALRMLPPLR